MCRLLSLVSPHPNTVYEWIYTAENPLVEIARPGYKGESYKGHRDGWGIAWYIRKGYMMVKEPIAIFESSIANNIISQAISNIILLHVRYATEGLSRTYVNTHPFTFKLYTFIHNGELKRDLILSLIPNEFREYIYGATDSEAFFIYLISRIMASRDMATALVESLSTLVDIGDGLTISDIGPSLNFVLSDGDRVYAFKWRLKDDDTHYSLYYRELDDGGFLVSSEPLDKSRDWISFRNGQLIIVDREGLEESVLVKA